MALSGIYSTEASGRAAMANRAGAISQSRAKRPLSITVIGIYMLFAACLMPSNVFSHGPAFLMGGYLGGWKAIVFFVAMAALNAVIGIGLLTLATWSRIAAIYFLAFKIVNGSMTLSLPGSRARFEQSVEALRASQGR